MLAKSRGAAPSPRLSFTPVEAAVAIRAYPDRHIRIRSSKRSAVSGRDAVDACAIGRPIFQPVSFTGKLQLRVMTDRRIGNTIMLSGARPIVIKSSTSSCVIPLMTSFGMLLS
jgi:hypothetical protein